MPQSNKNLMASRKDSSSATSNVIKKGGPFLLNESSADDLSHGIQDSNEKSSYIATPDEQLHVKQIVKRESGSLENNNLIGLDNR